jgi:hypothetical protein
VGGILVGPEEAGCPACWSKVALVRLVSYGSYVFDEPPKYDLVYRPWTREDYIACCPHCGYAQTEDKFEDVSAEQVARLKAAEFMRQWQPTDPSTEVPFPTRLERAIKTNEVLGRDRDFWVWFNRIAIFHYRSLDPAKARQVAEQEIGLLKDGAGTLLKKQRLYLLGEYSRLVGDFSAAREFFRKARRTSVNDEIVVLPLLAGGASASLGALLALVLLKRRRMLLVGLAAAALVGVTLGVALWYPLRALKQPDGYLNSLIDDRVRLTDATSQPAGESPGQ